MKETSPPDELHESDEELRFFSTPPAHEQEVPSLSPTTRDLEDTEEPPPSHDRRAEIRRFEAWRTKLRRGVVATLSGATALLLVAGIMQQRVDAERAVTSPAVPRVAPYASAREAELPAPSASESAPVAPVPSVSLEPDSAALIRKARELLRAGRSREGVVAARDAMTQAPSEAEPYVLLGAGLQDLGDFMAARSVFAECVEKATHGPSATCRYFAKR